MGKRKNDDTGSSEPSKILKINDNSSSEFSDYLAGIKKKRSQYFMSDYKFNSKRILPVSGPVEWQPSKKCVLYWMSRDQRVQDNWAFIYAQKLSMKFKVELKVCFCLVSSFLGATIRHYGFMLKGLKEVETECRSLKMGFYLLKGKPKDEIPKFVNDHQVGAVIADFSPLKLHSQWIDDVTKAIPEDVSLSQVDAHNVVPVWKASPKLEYGARTIRSKINKQLDEYLTEFPPVVKQTIKDELPEPVDWNAVDGWLQVDRKVGEVSNFKPGFKAGMENLFKFINSHKLTTFNANRNDPTKSSLSNVSPWLHFGQISPQRCILEVRTKRNKIKEGVDIFVEECLVRRELADNFCYYNKDYDNIKGAWEWAQKTLSIHKKDKRPYVYTLKQLENSQTHDALWNAAQNQMVREGKMHGFLRMYWAKKILEWTPSTEDKNAVEEALYRAIYLNDRYSLDGRDPNGYTGIMWSICGVHDQGWRERDVFGKIRYMNYEGCKRKFDVKAFELKYK